MSTPFGSFTQTSNANNYVFEDDRQQSETPFNLHSSNPWQSDEDYNWCIYIAATLKIRLREMTKIAVSPWEKLWIATTKNIRTTHDSTSTIQGRLERLINILNTTNNSVASGIGWEDELVYFLIFIFCVN